jgi:hypothetical protein
MQDAGTQSRRRAPESSMKIRLAVVCLIPLAVSALISDKASAQKPSSVTV